MKKLLATTAMVLVLGAGINTFVNANKSSLSIVYDANQFTEISLQQKVLALAANMYRGDFQQVARSVLSSTLYSGDGSAQMGSIRMFRY